MASGPEDRLKKRLRDTCPSEVWWFTIPTQIGRSGLKPPFDVVLCVKGTFVAMELKWMKGFRGLAPHQLKNLAMVARAGGWGLCVDGREGGMLRVYDVRHNGRQFIEIEEGEFWQRMVRDWCS